MALNLSGIHNVGDFYSPHYLEASLEGDLKDLLVRWKEREEEGGRRTPARELAGLADAYFNALSQARREKDRSARWRLTQDFHLRLLSALGYEPAPRFEVLENGRLVPVLLSQKRDDRPYLWIVEAPFPVEEDAGAFDETASGWPLETSEQLAEEPWNELLDGPVLRQEHPPRWVIYLGGGDLFLIDRYKWPQGRYLQFELADLFGCRQAPALQALAALVHQEVLNPLDGSCLHETLDENSHKHAYAVSTDLKDGARKAIELVGNEALHYMRTVSKARVYDRPELARQLTDECLVYLYRLLFLFYVESRGGELGVVPMKSDTYRQGYSLEHLRDLELVPLTSPEAQNGYYLDASLKQLFRLVQDGFGSQSEGLFVTQNYGFEIQGLRSELFDDKKLPLLRPVKMRNFVLQKVLETLSLSQPKGRQQRGRISYAQLGINQLGAVYEGLLSYTGFFAQEDLYEVKSAKEMKDKEARVYFVEKSRLEDYNADEVVKDAEGQPVRHEKGSFLFRLAGRDREKSASYYTPEVLTKCLTKHTLAERLQGLKADEILELTVCEPAMGSGAFLNEALNQLADAYLERKQAELGEMLPADRYQRERQKIKYFLAAHNLYGVDKNPRAAMLGEVSIWLNCLVGATENEPAFPALHMGARLATGNSLIGARRQAFRPGHLVKGAEKKWFNTVPESWGWDQPRPAVAIYHFLLPDPGMAPFDGDKKITALFPTEVKALKAWRKDLSDPFHPDDLTSLQRISERVDRLWEKHLVERQRFLTRIRHRIKLWGQKLDGEREEVHYASTLEEELRNFLRGTAPGRHLAAVMDYWCALWFWPVQQAGLLPTRDQWMLEVEALLDERNDVNVMLGRKKGRMELAEFLPSSEQGDLFAEERPVQGRLGEAVEAPPRLKVVGELADRYRFHHWDLAFSEVFAGRGGFDLILGNPPWVKVSWEEHGVLSDIEPLLYVRGMSAKQAEDKAVDVLINADCRSLYATEFEEQCGTQFFLNSVQSYPLLQGSKSNLYKCFLTRAFELVGPPGCSGFVHPEGIYDDPKGGELRRAVYRRLRGHFAFVNELLLFEEVHHLVTFSINVYGPERAPSFKNAVGLYVPRTLEESLVHKGLGESPGTKLPSGDWDTRGHLDRILMIGEAELRLFGGLADEPEECWEQVPLRWVLVRPLFSVLEKVRACPRTVGTLRGKYFPTTHLNETTDQKLKIIRRETRWPDSPEELIFQGPHFHVGTPFAKTPREGCSHNQDYDKIDLQALPDDYLPRTNYVRNCSPEEFFRKVPSHRNRPFTDYFRLVYREMLLLSGERTLISAILQPGPGHIFTIYSLTFDSVVDCVSIAGLFSSLPLDGLVRIAGRPHLQASDAAKLPYPLLGELESAIHFRTLRLNCLTQAYSSLWLELFRPTFCQDAFTKSDPRLSSGRHLNECWNRDTPIRSPYARRQALLELDALAALALGLRLDELLTIYRVLFAVLQQYERETYYDARGEIIFTVNRGLSDVGLDRKQFQEIRQAKAGDELPDWASEYVPPFDRCDREEDMTRAYEEFTRRYNLARPEGEPSLVGAGRAHHDESRLEA